MIPEHHQRYYAFVWPLFWPWLWLQLWRLERWQRQTGRGVLLAVDRRGNVFIRAVAEAPGKWRYEAPAVPVWQRPEGGLAGCMADCKSLLRTAFPLHL